MFYNELLKFYDENLANTYTKCSMVTKLNNPIIVTIDENGNIKEDIYQYKNTKKSENFLNPHTPSSIKRGGEDVDAHPHIFFDNSKIIFGFDKGEVKWSGSEPDTNGFINKIFMSELKKFNESEFASIETQAIEKFYLNKNNVEKLFNFINENKIDKKFILFKLVTDKTISDAELWNNIDIKNNWMKYYDKYLNNDYTTCHITGTKNKKIDTTFKIQKLGSTIFTSKHSETYVNSNKVNKPSFCYDTNFKITNAINYLLDNSHYNIGVKNTIVFSPNNDTEFSDELDKLQNHNDYTDIHADEVISSIKTHTYDSDIIKNNNTLYFITFEKSGKVLTVSDMFMINRGELYHNLDFWKNNCICQNINKDKSIVNKRFSINNLLNNLDESELNRNKTILYNCLIHNTKIPNLIFNCLYKHTKQLWVSNLGKNHHDVMYKIINDIDKKIISMKNYNNAKDNNMNNTETRDKLIGKIYMSLFDMVDYYNYKNNCNDRNNFMFMQLGEFMSNPQRVIEKFFTIKKYILAYAERNKIYALRKFHELEKEFSKDDSMKLTGKITDYSDFARGKNEYLISKREYFNSLNKKNNDTDK